METTYETAARTRKVLALVDTARQAGATWVDLDAFTDAQWDLLAEAAGVNPPSLLTRRCMVEAMRHAESQKAALDAMTEDELFDV